MNKVVKTWRSINAVKTNNGASWTAVAGITSGSTWKSIAYGSAGNAGNRFVAVGPNCGMAVFILRSINEKRR
jgi:hypothetical protein